MKAKLGLAERIYRCDGCGLVLDRDVNAARNLLSPRRQWGGEAKRRGRDAKTAPGAARPAEPGTRHPAPGTPHGGKTGTAARQQAAAA